MHKSTLYHLLAATLFAVSFFISPNAHAQIQSPFIIHDSERSIESLPPDNMPCLFPGMSAVEKMPTDRMPGLSYMPNALPSEWFRPYVIPTPMK